MLDCTTSTLRFPYGIYSTTHFEPLGMVTVTPDEIEIGPDDTALDPEVIVYVALTVCVFS